MKTSYHTSRLPLALIIVVQAFVCAVSNAHGASDGAETRQGPSAKPVKSGPVGIGSSTADKSGAVGAPSSGEPSSAPGSVAPNPTPALDGKPPSPPPAANTNDESVPPSVPMPDVETLPASPSSASPSALPPAMAPDGAPSAAPSIADMRAQSRQVTFTLQQLGAQGPLMLRGSSELSGVRFGIRQDEVVTAARLKLSGATSPALLPQYSNITVTLNEQYLGTIPVVSGKSRFENVEFAIDPIFFSLDNRLNFRLSGQYAEKCNDPLSGLLWANIQENSSIVLTLVRLPPQRDLGQLPTPFFDAHEDQTLVLPFVTSRSPRLEELQASGIVASWFGQLAGARGAKFPVSSAIPANGNAIVVAMADAIPPELEGVKVDGPTLAILPNAKDPSGSLLLVSGRDDKELVTAAKFLVVGNKLLSGTTARVDAPEIRPRKPYDAPAWIPTDRPITFGELVPASELQAVGFTPGPVRVPFKTAPDLYTWRDRGFPAEIHYRGPPGPIVDLSVSRLDVAVNDIFLASMPLAEQPAKSWLPPWMPSIFQNSDVRQLLSSGTNRIVRDVDVPRYDVFGKNELEFTFDTRPLSRGACNGIPSNPRMSVDPDSTLDLSRAYRFATLPNLAFFVNSGFPFSRMADLSETAVMLPRQPSSREIEVYLDLLGRIGSLTGYPALGVTLAKPEDSDRVADRDLLLVGTVDHLGGAAGLLRGAPLRLEGKDIRVGLNTRLDLVGRFLDDDPAKAARVFVEARPVTSLAAIVASESPLKRGRSLVAFLAGSDDALQRTQALLHDPVASSKIDGDLAFVSDARPTSYQIGPTYAVGTLPFWLYPSFILHGSPTGLLLVLVIGTVLLCFAAYRALRRRAAARMRQIEPENQA